MQIQSHLWTVTCTVTCHMIYSFAVQMRHLRLLDLDCIVLQLQSVHREILHRGKMFRKSLTRYISMYVVIPHFLTLRRYYLEMTFGAMR